MKHQTADSRTLIEPAQLLAHLDDPDWVVVDCRFELTRPQAGREAYRRGHIPGAHYAHLDEDLSGPVTPTTGRHPLPDPHTFAAQLARWGINASTQVVAYDEAAGAYASRLWWLLRWLGHLQVAVLNGGLKTWLEAGFPQDARIPALASARSGPPIVANDLWLSTADVQKGLADGDIDLIDARGADRFAGRNETIDPVPGHVPGARNHPFVSNLDASHRFLPAEHLRAQWLKTLGTTPAAQIVCMCGSGVTACHNLLALEIAGLRGARLYAGSWSEWIRDPRRPVSADPAP